MSRGPLPGGYTVGEKVFYTGPSHTFSDEYKLVHGKQGKVMGPAVSESHKGSGVSVLFPGNKGNIECLIVQVRRLRAVPTATPTPTPSCVPTSAGEPRSATDAAGRLQGG